MNYCICGGILEYVESWDHGEGTKREYGFVCVKCEKTTVLEDFKGKIKIVAYR